MPTGMTRIYLQLIPTKKLPILWEAFCAYIPGYVAQLCDYTNMMYNDFAMIVDCVNNQLKLAYNFQYLHSKKQAGMLYSHKISPTFSFF